LWVDSTFAPDVANLQRKIMGTIRLRHCRPEALAAKTAKLLFENGREDEKASAGGAQVFLETRAPTFNSTTYKKVVPAQHI
tara:strand:- start:199 stop:441 length:243 start_codon:yes stop_codon:yes gene_type:complete